MEEAATAKQEAAGKSGLNISLLHKLLLIYILCSLYLYYIWNNLQSDPHIANLQVYVTY